MSEAITTERLRGLVKTWQRMEPNTEITALLIELLDRRVADPTDEDRDTLQYLKCFAEEAHEAAASVRGMEPELAAMSQRALVLLDRLLERKP